MKTPEEIGRKLQRRYDAVWADEALAPGSAGWPYSVNIGKPTRAELESAYAQVDAEASALVEWAQRKGLTCAHEQRLVGRVSYALLSHVQAADAQVLAAAVGKAGHLRTYRERAERLRSSFPEASEGALRSTLKLLNRDAASDVDFDLVCRAAQWFQTHDASGLTPREVPLEGFHAKWLDHGGHRKVVCLLSGKDGLALKERPRLVRFRYLDPEYLATGARAHDSWLEGDACVPAYEPDVVVICENRDSALWFPELPGGIAVLGDGRAGIATLVQVPWLMQARCALYWGDMDIAGMEILAAYREAGLNARSMFMDMVAYERYQRFGTDVDARGHALAGKDAAPLEHLTDAENELYLHLCSADCTPRRIEQERIPLDVARQEARRIVLSGW